MVRMKLGIHFYQCKRKCGPCAPVYQQRNEVNDTSALPMPQSELVSFFSFFSLHFGLSFPSPVLPSLESSWGHEAACSHTKSRDLALPDREHNAVVPVNLSNLVKRDAPDQHPHCELLS